MNSTGGTRAFTFRHGATFAFLLKQAGVRHANKNCGDNICIDKYCWHKLRFLVIRSPRPRGEVQGGAVSQSLGSQSSPNSVDLEAAFRAAMRGYAATVTIVTASDG